MNTLNGWLILRTATGKTLKLAETLREDGYDAWSPVETRTIRIPRMNARRTVFLPIMPTYVFARAHHYDELVEMERMPVKPRRMANMPSHASFSILQIHERTAFVPDDQLDQLRRIEFKRTLRKKALEALKRGQPVTAEGGVFGGKSGAVVRSDKMHTLVLFVGDNFPVKIRTSLFSRNDIGEVEALMGEAARKAA